MAKKKSRFKLSILSLFLASLFFLVFFSRRALETKFFLTRDLLSQTPVSFLLPPPGSVAVHVNVDGLTQPATQESDPIDENVTVSSESSETEVEETEPVSSEPDLDDRKSENTTVPSISSDPEPEGGSGEITGEPALLSEKTTVPISSKSDLDGEPGFVGEKEKSSEDASENRGFLGNLDTEKLRNCDIYRGTWVKDEGYPLYRPGSCPYVDDGFDCQGNGRPDSAYLQWRWQPNDCDLPRFNFVNFV